MTAPHNSLLRFAGISAAAAALGFVLFGGVKTPANFRVLSDLVQNLLVLQIVLLVFPPDRRTLANALWLGVFLMVFDFVLETAAVHRGWWRPLGGAQYPPILVVPLEMIIGFLIMGVSIGILFSVPERIREATSRTAGRLYALFRNARRATLWQMLLIALTAAAGTYGDYTAGPEIWAPGPDWHPLGTFFVWLGSGLIALAVYHVLARRRGDALPGMPRPSP